MATYRKTTFNPWCLPIWLGAAGLLIYAFAWLRLELDSDAGAAYQFATGLVCLVGFTVSYLRVVDDTDRLRIYFGPIPFFGAKLPYESIEFVEPTTLNPLLPAPLGVPGVWAAFGCGMGSGVRIRMGSQGQWWPPRLWARTYEVACREPEEVIAAIAARLEGPSLLFAYDRETDVSSALVVLLALAVGFTAAMVELAWLFGVTLFLLVAWGLALHWVTAGYKVMCTEDEILIRYFRYGRLRIDYRSITDVTQPGPRPSRRWWQPGTMRFGMATPNVRIHITPPQNPWRAKGSVDAVDLAVDDPERLKAVLREKMLHAEPAAPSSGAAD